MAAKKKTLPSKTPPPTPVLDDLDIPIEGVKAIAKAIGIHDRSRLRTVLHRLKLGYIPGFQRGERWFSTKRMLASMNTNMPVVKDQSAEVA
jgi:hypothetical protein